MGTNRAITKERLAGNKFGEICVCVSPTQAKMYAIKPKIPETYYQPDALYSWVGSRLEGLRGTRAIPRLTQRTIPAKLP